MASGKAESRRFACSRWFWKCTGEPPVLRVATLEIATATEVTATAARVSAAEVATTEIGPAAEPGV